MDGVENSIDKPSRSARLAGSDLGSKLGPHVTLVLIAIVAVGVGVAVSVVNRPGEPYAGNAVSADSDSDEIGAPSDRAADSEANVEGNTETNIGSKPTVVVDTDTGEVSGSEKLGSSGTDSSIGDEDPSGPAVDQDARADTTDSNSDANPRGEQCYSLVFRDDFDGNSVDQNVWSLYNSEGNAGFGLRRPEAIALRDGYLTITAQNNADGILVSGGMSHNQKQTYGKYRVKVRTDADPGEATSGVVITWPAEVHTMYGGGENNIYETVTEGDRSPFYSFVHKPVQDESRPGTEQVWMPWHADGTQWQIMTMTWTPTEITITREGPGETDWEQQSVAETAEDLIPDVDHRITIQLDAWEHSNDHTVTMQVDWVEMYSYCS